jgi:type IV fimbrial biogenesis protein FimT
MASHRSRREAIGFTLIEMMVTITVLAVVLAFALPGLRSFTATNQVAAIKSAFAGSVALARTEAARQGRTITLMAVAGGPDGNEFARGWVLQLDDKNEMAVLRRYEALPDAVRMRGDRRLTFTATGHLTPVAAHTFTVCPASGGDGFLVTVPPSGMAEVQTLTADRCRSG